MSKPHHPSLSPQTTEKPDTETQAHVIQVCLYQKMGDGDRRVARRLQSSQHGCEPVNKTHLISSKVEGDT